VNIFIFVSEQWLLISLLFALIGFFLFTEQRKSGKTLGTAELVRLMNSDQAVVVDVRTTAEFESGHIHGSRNIPHTKLASRIGELEKSRGKTIVVVDKIGQHSAALANFSLKIITMLDALAAASVSGRAQAFHWYQVSNSTPGLSRRHSMALLKELTCLTLYYMAHAFALFALPRGGCSLPKK